MTTVPVAAPVLPARADARVRTGAGAALWLDGIAAVAALTPGTRALQWADGRTQTVLGLPD